MIDLIDKIIIYITFGLSSFLCGYGLTILKELKTKTQLNMDFNSKVILSLQEVNQIISETKNSLSLLMNNMGLNSIEDLSNENNEENSISSPETKKMDYAG
jgi:hypothetical protein